MRKYVKEYKWSNIGAMLRNLRLDPEICTEDFHDRTVVISGATSGIGYATAHKYASHGADIVSVSRDEVRSQRLCESLSAQYGVDCIYLIADFAKLADVHRVGKQVSALDRRIDVLIHNAGVFLTKKALTVDGHEMVFQVDYLGSFILNHYLREKLVGQGGGRIIFVNSEAYRFAVWGLHLDDLLWENHRYSGSRSYGAAKLAQLLSMIVLDEILAGTGVTIENKTVVVVGAGMAGLTASAYLAREGYRVLLLDKNDRVGGLVNTFDRDGFSFDAGPRAFVNSGIVKPILKDLGISLDTVDNRVSIGIQDQLVYVESMDSVGDYERMLRALYPNRVRDITKIVSMITKLSAYTEVLYGFDNPSFGNVMSDKKYVIRELLPWTIKFLRALRKMNHYAEPIEDFLARLTDSQSLIDISTQHFFKGTPTYFALGYFYGYLDYFYPKGGTGAVVSLLEEKLLSSGVELALNRQVVEVAPAASEVTDSEGKRYHYDHLIWAADLKTLYRSLNTAGLDQETIAKNRVPDATDSLRQRRRVQLHRVHWPLIARLRTSKQ